MWPLSVYGPAKTEATYITGTDLSPEEMRLRAYEARAQNKLNDYVRTVPFKKCPPLTRLLDHVRNKSSPISKQHHR